MWLRVLLVAMFMVVAVPSVWAQDKDLAAARKHMDAGVRYMQDPAGPKWDEAYLEFKKAYELSDSINALLNVAICAQKLELDGEAIALYKQVLASKKIDRRDRKQVENDLKVLEASVVWVTFTVNVPLRLTDVRTPRQGKALRNVYELEKGTRTLGIHPGAHNFTASAPGKTDQEWDVVLHNATKVEHTFDLVDKPPDEGRVVIKTVLVKEDRESRPIPLYVLAPGLLTVAAGGVMATFMVLSSMKASELEEARGVKPVAEQREIRDTLVTYNIIADVGIGVTAAAAVTTLVLILTRPTVVIKGDAEISGEDSDGTTEGATPPAEAPPAETPAPKETSMRFGEDWVIAPLADPYGGGAAFSVRF